MTIQRNRFLRFFKVCKFGLCSTPIEWESGEISFRENEQIVNKGKANGNMQGYRGKWRIKRGKYENGEVFIIYQERG